MLEYTYDYAILCRIKNGTNFIMYTYSNLNELLDFLPILVDSKKKYGSVIENKEYRHLGNKTGDYHFTILKRKISNYEIL